LPESAQHPYRPKPSARVEHVFAGLAHMGGKTLCDIGLARATPLRNWKAAYNLRRLCSVKTGGVMAF
jgi:IS5 family transposase